MTRTSKYWVIWHPTKNRKKSVSRSTKKSAIVLKKYLAKEGYKAKIKKI